MKDNRILVVVAGTTMALSGFLLFQVQPMMARYILPWFGGSATTWTVCLLFFQIVLLLGYAYAYLFTKPFQLRTQIVVHLVIVTVSLATLPITPSEAFKPENSDLPTQKILLLLIVSVGQHCQRLVAVGGDHHVIIGIAAAMAVMDHDAVRGAFDRRHPTAEPDLVARAIS